MRPQRTVTRPVLRRPSRSAESSEVRPGFSTGDGSGAVSALLNVVWNSTQTVDPSSLDAAWLVWNAAMQELSPAWNVASSLVSVENDLMPAWSSVAAVEKLLSPSWDMDSALSEVLQEFVASWNSVQSVFASMAPGWNILAAAGGPAAYRALAWMPYTSRTNTTVNVPAGTVDGDMLVAMFTAGGQDGTVTPSTPAGWTLFAGFPRTIVASGGFTVKNWMYWRPASSEPASYTFTHANGSTEAIIVAVQGAASGLPAVSSNQGTGTAASVTGLSVGDGGLALYLEQNWDLYGATTPPTNFTERLDDATSLVYVCSRAFATAGSTGTVTHTVPGVGPWSAYLVGIEAGAGSGDVAPAWTAPPTISGTPQAGQTLTVSGGTVTGTPTPTKTYQWKRSGVDISGATDSTWLATEGSEVTCAVTATNTAGSDTIETASFGPITAAGGGQATLRSTSWIPMTTRSSSATVTKPAGAVDGDLLVAMICLGSQWSAVPPTAPAGWTLLTGFPASVTAGQYTINTAVYWKVAASEPANYTFTYTDDGAMDVEVMVVAIQGAADTAPAVTTNASTSSSSGSTAGVTLGDGGLALYFEHNWDFYGSATPPTGFTERVDDATSVIYLADKEFATGAATGTVGHTVPGFGVWRAVLVGIEAGAGGGGGGDSAPAWTVAPTISGTAEAGQTLTVSGGTVTGNPTPTRSYQWQRGGSNISGATSQTWVATEGTAVTCEVTATNSQGSDMAETSAFGPIAAAGGGSGTPAVTSASVSSGTLTVGGSNFGTGTTSPLLWDDMEDGVDGASINASPKVGSWSTVGSDTTYTTAQKHSGTKSLFGPRTPTTQWQNFDLPLPDTTYLYLSFWFRYNYPAGDTGNSKLMQVHGNAGSGDFAPGVMVGGMAGDWWAAYISDETSTNNIDTQTTFVNGEPAHNIWHHYELILKQSTPNVANGRVTVRIDGVTEYEKLNVLTRFTSARWELAGFFAGMTNFSGASNTWLDECYAATTWARVELGNASTYAACTKKSIQPAATWSGSSITAPLNKGEWTTGQTVYVYVTNANGDVNSSGFALVIP